jgi:hypothetical protein
MPREAPGLRTPYLRGVVSPAYRIGEIVVANRSGGERDFARTPHAYCAGLDPGWAEVPHSRRTQDQPDVEIH